jgi:hypothetical protein
MDWWESSNSLPMQMVLLEVCIKRTEHDNYRQDSTSFRTLIPFYQPNKMRDDGKMAKIPFCHTKQSRSGYQ